MTRAYRLEQVFLRSRGGQLELLLVLETLAGARLRETLRFPTRDARAAVRQAAKHLARRGEVEDLSRLRLRVERGGRLTDDDGLRREFVSAFEGFVDREPGA